MLQNCSEYERTVDLALADCQQVVQEAVNRMITSLNTLRTKDGVSTANEILMITLKTRAITLIGNQDQSINFIEVVTFLLDCTIELAERDYVDTVFPFVVIEDLSDVLTINSAEILFDYLESRFEKLAAMDLEPDKGKGLILLRTCNELLRRLSKSKNTRTMGKIKLFLSSVFPICEKSGVNRKGAFNVDNHTDFVRSDDKKYSDIWGLQQYFANPLVLFRSSAFEDFRMKIDFVLLQFEEIVKDRDRQNNHHERKRRQSLVAEHFFPKYLTSYKLFELQINDPQFKRQILSQYLTTSQFLVSVLLQNKEIRTPINKYVTFTLNLSQDQEEWFERFNASKLLEKISPLSRKFANSMLTVLNHEENWIEWKADSCKSFELNQLPTLGTKPIAFPPETRACQPNFLGNDEMATLWSNSLNMENGLSANKTLIHKFILPIDELVREMDEQVDADLKTPLDGIEEEYLLFNQMTYNWLLFRTAIQSELIKFTDSDFDNFTPGRTLLKIWRRQRNSMVNSSNPEKGRWRDRKYNQENKA